VAFNDGWRFHLGEVAGAETPGFDDSGWRTLDLPHDWAIEGDFSQDNPSGTGGGALPGGIGWYRKTFDVAPALLKKHTYIDFDGAYMNATVYINGHKLGTRPYGYASFSYDLTPWLHAGRNVVAVHVDNAEQPNSRWYSGCGIYRNVWLRTLSDVHIPLWGQQIISEVTDNEARINISTELSFKKKERVRVCSELLNADGKQVAKSASIVETGKKNSATTVEGKISISDPHLWSPDSPYLYTLATYVQDAKSGEVLDSYMQPVGLRYYSFDAKNGFSLNGKRMKINGVCLHHDAGALGAVVNRRAIERQLQIMKEMGVNAIRSSHNPPAPELLELCDEMGLMVMNETFDMWRKKKTAHDYARYFNEWHERDMDDLIRRDRNHPSVIIWSIGNEVLEQWTDAAADTLSLEEANLILNFGHSKDKLASEGEMSVNSLLTRKLADRVRELDPTRPVTAG
ncbi:MAG: beta galactosidase jelly roll domain-containing protein, partial [Muribaculaceae bacterium]|nr:beta galactosidase jelly roll domain-containing protein [Muribaculaceae bacterium]